MRAKTTAALTILVLLTSLFVGDASAGAASAVVDGGPDWGAGFGGISEPRQEAGSVVPSPFGRPDAVGDALYQGGDITSIRVEHRNTTFGLTAKLRAGSNPASTTAWTQGVTFLEWAIDVNAGGGPDFFAGLYFDGSDVVAEVVRNNANFDHICFGTFTHATATQFKMEFPRSCISSHPTIRVAAHMVYDQFPTNPNAAVSEDFSPHSTWTPLVKRDRNAT